ncbi:MAG: hypothetical protein ACJ8BW_25925 [Ktedonobacteraceae bacterium]
MEGVLLIALCGCVCESKCLFERSDIEVEGRDGMPVQHVRVSREEVFHVRKGLAQLVEQLAQVIARLSLGGVGPEEEGQMLALLGYIAMQHEIGEQGAQARGIEAGHLLVVVAQVKIAKQAEVKGWHRHDRLAFLLFRLKRWQSGQLWEQVYDITKIIEAIYWRCVRSPSACHDSPWCS